MQPRNWPKRESDVGVLDLRWLCPLDNDGLRAAVKSASGKVVVLHEANRTGGFGAEVVARLHEFFGNDLALKHRSGRDSRHENSRLPGSPARSASLGREGYGGNSAFARRQVTNRLRSAEEIMMEFLVHMEVARIEGGEEREKQLREQEAARSRELAKQGMLVRLWRVPGRRENWGIWRADDCDQLHDCVCLLTALPLFDRLPFIPWHPTQRSRCAHSTAPDQRNSDDKRGPDSGMTTYQRIIQA